MFCRGTIVRVMSLLFLSCAGASAANGPLEVMVVQNPATAGDDFARRIHDLQVQLDQQQSLRDRQMAPKPHPLKAQRPPDAQPLSDTQHLSDGQSLLKAQHLLKAQRLLEAARDRDRAQRESSEIPQTNAAVAAESAGP
jgi:hypothetical protein